MNEQTTTRFRAGQKVVIEEVQGGFANSRYVGRTGTYLGTVGYGAYRAYLVRVDGQNAETIRCTRLNEAPATRTEPDELELSKARLQAATFAHQLLGIEATLDKLIGVAEFALATSGGEIQHAGGTVRAPSPAPAPADFDEAIRASGAAPATDRDRRLTDATVDITGSLEIRLDRTQDDDVVELELDGQETYLSSGEIDRLIEFLLAAQRVHRANRTAATPF